MSGLIIGSCGCGSNFKNSTKLVTALLLYVISYDRVVNIKLVPNIIKVDVKIDYDTMY